MKRFVIALAVVALSGFAADGAVAAGRYDPGASDSEIKLGTTWAFSGPVSSTSPVERQMAGVFAMVNDQGGVNGRKINFIALDDGYQPPKTVEQTRRLVEQDQVLLMYGQIAGDDLTRENILKVATSLHNLSIPLLLPGITLNTSATNYFPIHTLQLKRYDGTRWQLVGKPIEG